MTETSNDICVQRLDDAVQLKHAERWKIAKQAFEQIFKESPIFYVNVPGR